MFDALARFTSKYRIAVTMVWLVAAVCLFVFAPKLSDVGVTDESQFLPQDTQSAVADRLLAEKFVTTDSSDGSGVLLFHNEDGLSEGNLQVAAAVHRWLTSEYAPTEVQQVVSIFDNEALSAQLISSDQTTMMMLVNFSSDSLSHSTRTAIGEIRAYLEGYPDDDVYFTGNVGIYQDMLASVEQTIDRTTLVTVILVVVLLLIIYRSPVAIFLPLLAISASFAVSAGILGLLGAAGAQFSTLTEAYLVVIVFGVGTDYCLFTVSRFREELRQRRLDEARNHTLRHIGPVIAASAITVMVAFLSLGISDFGMYRTMGYALAIGVGITLLAGITLVPALTALFGKYLFWPAKTTGFKPESNKSFWQTIGNLVSRHPVVVALPITVLLLVPFLALPRLEKTSDMVNQLPQSSESVQGYRIMVERFPSGELSPLYVLVSSPGSDLTDDTSLLALEELSQKLGVVSGVTRVDYYAAPAADIAWLAAALGGLGDDLGRGEGLAQLTILQTAGDALKSLALAYPGVLGSPNFQGVGIALGEAGALAGQLQTLPPAELPGALYLLQGAVKQAADGLGALVGEFHLKSSTPFTASLLEAYFSNDLSIARINVTLAGKLDAAENRTAVADVREVTGEWLGLSSWAGSGSAYYVGGEGAQSADIMSVNNTDFNRVVILAVVGIMVVIAILLRSLVAPLYMVATVLLNYGTTLGIATWLFIGLRGQSGLIYLIPLFIFVILVALGADYNIFLVSRIREEARSRPIREAVSQAVTHTGGVITACGVILAGTFATLMTSPLEVVFQLGVAISLGVLLDTFLVRALLVPALAVLIKRWSWWPSRLSREKHTGDKGTAD
ncbi:MAG: MMPL family transporter [Dehalococcoidia bacterium]|nr:MMPL family transporter [Dehalococcoidia bacterium]